MPWNSVAPLGTVSVKANRPILGQNTTYIEDTMGNSIVGTNTVTTRDHFWDVSANLDGRHRFIQSVGFTVGGNPADPVLGTGMDGVTYLKSDGLTPSTITDWFRNVDYIYQYMPAYKTGSVANVPTTFINLTSVPDNCYGEIVMWPTGPNPFSELVSRGHFKTFSGVVYAFAYAQSSVSGNVSFPLLFGSGANAAGLDIRVRVGGATQNKDWQYVVTYRKIP